MTGPSFVRVGTVRELHDRAVQAFGGLPGLRDGGLLDSALARPDNLLAYSAEGAVDLYDLATAYAYGIAKNDAFHDGNKRTAWATRVILLLANGIAIRADQGVVVERMVALASGAMDDAAFAVWLRELPVA